jgi:RNA polymerase sigma-70 factor (ECF subfamily)
MDAKILADEFEAHRDHMRGVAWRLLGSAGEADDAVQESWLRLTRADAGAIGNLRAWLTTVVARICLDMLRARRSHREEGLEPRIAESIADESSSADPQAEIQLGDSVGLAMLVVLEKLTPAERLAFVLHDMFAVPFDDIARIIGRSPEAARQLASRARRRVQGSDIAPGGKRADHDRLISAFLTAARQGDFEALLAVLDPDVVVRADPFAVELGAAAKIEGAAAVATAFKRGRARGVELAHVDGAPCLLVRMAGKLRVILRFAIRHGRIVAIDAIGDPDRLAAVDRDHAPSR